MSIPIEYIIDAQWRGSQNVRRARQDIQQLDQTAKTGGRGVDDFGKSVTGLDSVVSNFVIGGGLAIAGSYLLDFGRDALNAASDIQETTSLIDNSLGDAASTFREELDLISEATGRSSNQLERGASTIVAMTRSMGLGQQAAAEYSSSFAQIALDLGSFFNQEPDQVFEDIQSALAGSSETLQKYGIDVRETTLQQAALNAGIIEQGDQLTRVQRAYILQQEVLRQAADAQGDAARTSESYANQVRALEDAFFDLQVVIGDELLPDVTQFVSGLGVAVGEINEFVDANEDAISRLREINDFLRESGTVTASPITFGRDAGSQIGLQIREFFGLRTAVDEVGEAYGESSRRASEYTSALEAQLGITNQIAQGEALVIDAVSNAGDAYFDTGASLATYTDRVAAYNARLEEREQAEQEAAEAAEEAARRFAEAQRQQAQSLADAFVSSAGLVDELLAAQSALAEAEGLGQNAEEEAARVIAANNAILDSYEQTVLTGLLSNVESIEQLQDRIAAAVDADLISQEQAEAQLRIAETTAAFEDLQGALDAGAIDPSQYGEIFDVLESGVTSSVPEAIELLSELDESFSALGEGLSEEVLSPVVEIEEAEAAVETLQASFLEFTENEYLALLQADSDPAIESLELLRTDMTAYDDTVYEAILAAEDEAARSAIEEVNALLSGLDGRTVTATVNVNVNQTSSGTGQAIPGFATGVQGFRVPAGFYNDNYLIGVSSGELVDVYTQGQQRAGMRGQNSGGGGGGSTTIVNNFNSAGAAAIGLAQQEVERERRLNGFMGG